MAVRSSWSPRYSVIAAFLTPAILLALVSLGIRWTEPTVPPIDLKGAHAQILEQIDRMTPAEWFQEWTYRYRPSVEPGFAVYQNQLTPMVAQQVSKKRLVQKVLLTLAAVFASGALVAALWPANRARRQAEMETRR